MKLSDSASIILHYFPELNDRQIDQFERLKELYTNWNQKINVISRKDIDEFYIHHVLHSLAIAKFVLFNPNANILDVGTGGGFPGLPLAIYFQETNFKLVDSIGKKIKVVNEISSQLKLNNISAHHLRAEQVKEKFDFIISRAVTHLSKFCPWVVNNISEQNNHKIKNGIIYLKGGDLREEISSITRKYHHSINKIPNYFNEPFFETKIVLHLTKKLNK